MKRPVARTAAVHAASWLSDDVLLIVAEGTESPSDARLELRGESQPLEVRSLEIAAPAEGPTAVLTARLLRPRDPHEPVALLLPRVDAPVELSDLLVDLRATARTLAGNTAERREAVLEFLVGALVEHAGTVNTARLHKSVYVLREALRERLPAVVMARGESLGLGLEAVLAVNERAFYVKGWLHHEDGAPASLTAVSPEGQRTELLETAFRHRRADMEHFYGTGPDLQRKHGFISFFELEVPSSLPSGWILELREASGDGVEIRGPDVVRDVRSVRDTILADLAHEGPRDDKLTVGHVFPAMSRMQQPLGQRVEPESVLEYGTADDSTDVSLVIPLFRRIDLLEHQLAQFAHDPEIRGADVIYVLDSPELAEAAVGFADELFQLYRTPFRLVILPMHGGYAAVNNTGAALARRRLLLLLNSDVLPDGPGWLGRMAAFYDATPGVGALGAKLLYEDDSLQHAGMYFAREPGSALWENRHYFKGMHRSLPAANFARSVPAVTAACLMIDRELYERVDGLRGLYVLGDNEDSDLCLRLAEEGLESWYLPEVELYHLEGQSLPSGARELSRRYNAWLQTRLWGGRIEALSAAPDEAGVLYGGPL